MKFYCDDQRHLVCLPYSIENLHAMARQLSIKRCWFHKDHYDIPKRRVAEVQKLCYKVSPKWIAFIVRQGRPCPACTGTGDIHQNCILR